MCEIRILKNKKTVIVESKSILYAGKLKIYNFRLLCCEQKVFAIKMKKKKGIGKLRTLNSNKRSLFCDFQDNWDLKILIQQFSAKKLWISTKTAQ
jgi:hypothetical protein